VKISDELSAIAANAIASKRKELARKTAVSKQQKIISTRNLNFLLTVREELYLSGWNGSGNVRKDSLTEWQIELLKANRYVVNSNDAESSALLKILKKDLPKSIVELVTISFEASKKYSYIKNNKFISIEKNWKILDLTELKKWLNDLSDAFSIAANKYNGEASFLRNNEVDYLSHVNRLDSYYKFVRGNLNGIDAAYNSKLIEAGLLSISPSDPAISEKTARKKKIVRRVLEELQRDSWHEVSESEIKLIFFSVRNKMSLTSAALALREHAPLRPTDDDEVIDLIADFAEKKQDTRGFDQSHNLFKSTIVEVTSHLEQITKLASQMQIIGDPLNSSNVRKGYIFFPSSKSVDFEIYDFFVGAEFKKFKFDFELQLRRAAKNGNKKYTLKCNEFEQGVDLFNNSIPKIFFPFSLDSFLKLVSSNGLGYEVFDEKNFKYTINLLWN